MINYEINDFKVYLLKAKKAALLHQGILVNTGKRLYLGGRDIPSEFENYFQEKFKENSLRTYLSVLSSGASNVYLSFDDRHKLFERYPKLLTMTDNVDNKGFCCLNLDIDDDNWQGLSSFWMDRSVLQPNINPDINCDVFFLFDFDAFDWRQFFSSYGAQGGFIKKERFSSYQSKSGVLLVKKILKERNRCVLINIFGSVLCSDDVLDELVHYAFIFQPGWTHKVTFENYLS